MTVLVDLPSGERVYGVIRCWMGRRVVGRRGGGKASTSTTPTLSRLPLVDDDVDEVAVERIMAGTLRPPRHARSLERIEAIRQLAGRGMSDIAIGARLGMKTSAVFQARSRHDIPAGKPRGEAAA
jgi:hypothetical protein